jgi:GNAT superfamily N-acetyltransferase
VIDIHRAEGEARRIALQRLESEWRGMEIRVRDRAYRFTDCEILVAGDGAGLLAYDLADRPTAELVALNAFEPHCGTGTALLNDLLRRLQGDGFEIVRLTITNDNLDALRFYQRRGFRMAALRPGAVDRARKLKPSIPEVGAYGLPMRDEIDLILDILDLGSKALIDRRAPPTS